MKRLWMAGAIACACLVGTAVPKDCELQAYAAEEASLGQKAPLFSLSALTGQEFKLQDVVGKKSVLLVFSASWCPYCREEVPELNRIYRDYKGKNLAIYTINIKESDRRAGAWVKKAEIRYPMLMDREGEVASQYNVTGIPLTVMIDKTGKVCYYGNALPSRQAINKTL